MRLFRSWVAITVTVISVLAVVLYGLLSSVDTRPSGWPAKVLHSLPALDTFLPSSIPSVTKQQQVEPVMSIRQLAVIGSVTVTLSLVLVIIAATTIIARIPDTMIPVVMGRRHMLK
jgi:hypothetical protein